MKIFISWSGSLTQSIAEELRDWLPRIIQKLEPFVSSEDIEKGARWASDLTKRLEDINYGIVCLTQDNKEAAWIQFEAGALSKASSVSKVTPVLFDLNPSSLSGNPLVQFQSVGFNKKEMYQLLASINDLGLPPKLTDRVLRETFDLNWPTLEEKIRHHLGSHPSTSNHRAKTKEPGQVTLEEISANSREMLRQIKALEDRLAEFTQAQPRIPIFAAITVFTDALSEHFNAIEAEIAILVDEFSSVSASGGEHVETQVSRELYT